MWFEVCKILIKVFFDLFCFYFLLCRLLYVYLDSIWMYQKWIQACRLNKAKEF